VTGVVSASVSGYKAQRALTGGSDEAGEMCSLSGRTGRCSLAACVVKGQKGRLFRRTVLARPAHCVSILSFNDSSISIKTGSGNRMVVTTLRPLYARD